MLKRTLLWLCILALLLSGAGAYAKTNWSLKEPERGSDAELPGGLGLLIDHAGVILEVTGVSLRDGEIPQLRFDVWVTNESGGTLNFHFNDVYVDGEEVDGIGIYDLANGSSIAEYFFLEPLDGQGAEIFRNPRAISFNILVEFDSTGSEFFTQACGMTGPFGIASEAAHPTVRPFSLSTVRPHSYSTPRPTAMPDYRWLERGSEGSDVRRLQLALISLGYLEGSADGVYGDQTAQAVYDFNKQNGLLIGVYDDEASPTMQEALFGGEAEPYCEPPFSLEINYDSNGRWENASGDRLKMRVEVHNAAKRRTVRAFELYMYATDVWGERIYGEDQVYYDTTTKNIGPGKTAYSDYMVIPYRSRIDKVYVGISKIVYTDGSVEEPAYGVEYWNWEIW